jgi:hypothetical protein
VKGNLGQPNPNLKRRQNMMGTNEVIAVYDDQAAAAADAVKEL